MKRTTQRPRLTHADRAFWVALSRLWTGWQHALILVKPETVIRWHRKGFKLYWTWKSRNQGGRPRIDADIRLLIRRMARENPTWGAPRIHGESRKLGFEVSEATVSRDIDMPRRAKPPSQTWRSFLHNHAQDLVSIDLGEQHLRRILTARADAVACSRFSSLRQRNESSNTRPLDRLRDNARYDLAADDVSSSLGEFHPHALTEPYVNLSIHTAPVIQSQA